MFEFLSRLYYANVMAESISQLRMENNKVDSFQSSFFVSVQGSEKLNSPFSFCISNDGRNKDEAQRCLEERK